MRKIISIIKYVLLAVCVVALIPIFINGGEGIDFILWWAFALLILALACSILFPLINLAQNPKGAMRTLIGLGAVAVIVGIAYALSSTEPVVTVVQTFDNPTALKITDTQLYTAYFALAGAVLAAVLGEIRNSFK